MLIFAGPGSGKTRVLTSRIAAFVLERDFFPSRLRAVTFTRAATVEMRKRLIGFTPWENTPEEIEDECRVLYVAMSRAKDQLYLLGRNKQMFPNLEALITFLKVQTL